VELLTIGAFARAARLTPKALRLYDQLGLLPPAAVDPDSGYRWYEEDQLDRARLIAQLRRLGMPLAEIRMVSALPPAEAAAAVTAYWQQVTAETAERARLATHLVADLTGGIHHMRVRAAAATDIGAVRQENQDFAYGGEQLLAVADGSGGTGGAAAARAAVDALRSCASATTDALLAALAEADRAIRAWATDEEQPCSTVTALVPHDSRLTLVHVGDTRAYLLRGDKLTLLTQDHTWVRAQVEAGLLSPAEAESHPQRALLVRALGANGEIEADLAVRTAAAGDRYLLCSDGLYTVVDHATLRSTLSEESDPFAAVDRLIELARAGGAPDNIACVVADVTAG
jgi:serine/threonine protein phosphatase PrpC